MIQKLRKDSAKYFSRMEIILLVNLYKEAYKVNLFTFYKMVTIFVVKKKKN
jgi:hypothetical protein